VNCISKAEYPSLGVFLCNDIVDVPLADIENLEWNSVISNHLLDSFRPFLVCWWRIRLVTLHREHNENPLVPRLYHARESNPGKVRVFKVVLITPMKISGAIINVLAEVNFDQNIPG
jgi:hypothetical protein